MKNTLIKITERFGFSRKGDAFQILISGVLSLSLKVVAAVCAFGLTWTVSRYLGAEEAGAFFLSFAIIVVVSSFTRIGLDHAVMRFISVEADQDNWSAINGIYRNAMVLAGGLSIAAGLLLYIYGEAIALHVFNKPKLGETLSIFGLALPPFTIIWLHSFAYQALGRIPLYNWCQNLGNSFIFLGLFGAVFLLHWLGFSNDDARRSEAMATLFVAATYGTLCIALFFWMRAPRASLTNASFDTPTLIKTAFPLSGVLYLGMMMQWTTQLMLGYFAELSEVTIFNAAYRVAMLISIILIAINSVTFRRYASLYEKGEMEKLKRLAIWATRAMVLLAVPIIGTLAYFAPFIMSIFGEEFREGATALRVLLFGQFISIAAGSVGGLLSMTGHQRLSFYSSLATTTFLVVLAFILIPQSGLIGAAIAQAAAVSTLMVLNTLAVKRTLNFMPVNIFAKV